MAAKRRSLGKGLDALLSSSSKVPVAGGEKERTTGDGGNTVGDRQGTAGTGEIPVEFIQRGRYQPRTAFDADLLQELADSITAQGLIQPIVVRLIGDQRYEIIAGERRWRAAQLAGLASIPAVVREVDDEAAIAMALIENIQREDLNPVEEATALARLQTEFSLTQQEVADAVGKSRSTVANLLRLMSLQSDVRTLLERGDLDMGHARCLLALEGEQQVQAARQVVAGELSVRQTEALVRKLQSGGNERASTGDQDPNIRRLQNDLAEKLGTPVQIQHQSGGSGKLVLRYGDLDELDGILAHIK